MKTSRFRQWLVAQLLFGVLRIVKLLPPDAAIDFAGRQARRFGPRLRRHKLVLASLRNAFPEKSPVEIEALAKASWEQLGRMVGEYVFFEKLFDLGNITGPGSRVEVTGQAVLDDLNARPRAYIFMTAHTGNFEILPYAATSTGAPIAILYRPPNNPYIADYLARLRGAGSTNLVPSLAGSSMALARQLAGGKGIGILVDQKFARGLNATFFGLPAKTNPLVARLARQFDCEVFPARPARVLGNRYRIDVEPALDLPRDSGGEVDVERSTQIINDKVESWVRACPEQWLWYHDRWNTRKTLD